MTLGRSTALFCIVGFLGLLAGSASAASVVSVQWPDQVGLYEKFEAVFTLDREYENPFDPSQIDARAQITAPSGRIREVPAFYYQDFDRSLDQEREVFTPRQDPQWRVRLAPLETGNHNWRLLIKDDQGLFTTEMMQFESVPTEKPGFVRVDPENPHYFSLDDGQGYFPLGFNTCWSVLPSAGYDIERYYGLIAESGGNWSRLWMCHYGEGFTIEWNQNHHTGYYLGLGRYSMEVAFRLDKILEAAEEAGIRVQIVLNHHSAFETENWSSWEDNPFNQENGGPLERSMDLFTDPEANRLYDNRIRYIVARWAYSPAVLCWELWNEVDIITGYDPDLVGPWQRQKVALIREMDPCDHLITTSYANSFYFPGQQDWAYPGFGFTQRHMYLYNNLVPILEGSSTFRGLGKPSFVAEMGIEYTGELDRLDYRGLHIHNGIWASLASGYGGGAMSWWWDAHIQEFGLWYVNAAPSLFLAGEDLSPYADALGDRLSIEAGSSRVEAVGVAGEDRAIVWLHDTDSVWWGDLEEPFARTEGVVILLIGLKDGPYTAEVWNTFDGSYTEFETLSEDGELYAVVPAFSRDTALKIRQVETPDDDDEDDDDDDAESDDDADEEGKEDSDDDGCGC